MANTFAYMVYKLTSVPCLLYYAGRPRPHLPRPPPVTLGKQLALAAPCRSQVSGFSNVRLSSIKRQKTGPM